MLRLINCSRTALFARLDPRSPSTPRASLNRNDSPLPTNPPHSLSLRREPSVITDLGGQLSYDYRQSRAFKYGLTKPKPLAKTRNELESRLFDALEHNKSSQGGQGFFALDMLAVLLLEQIVAKKLSKHLGKIYLKDAIDRLAHQICSETPLKLDDVMKPRLETYSKVFPILVLIGKAESVVKFLQARDCDADFPLVRRRSPTGDWSMRRHRDVCNELGCSKSGWCKLELRNFDHWQWTTLSPFFSLSQERKEVNHYRLQDETIIPFMDEATVGDERKPVTIELLGGGRRVFKVRIHPEHHSFHGILQVTLPIPTWQLNVTGDRTDSPPPSVLEVQRHPKYHPMTNMSPTPRWTAERPSPATRSPHPSATVLRRQGAALPRLDQLQARSRHAQEIQQQRPCPPHHSPNAAPTFSSSRVPRPTSKPAGRGPLPRYKLACPPPSRPQPSAG